jgi:hypothetical protein
MWAWYIGRSVKLEAQGDQMPRKSITGELVEPALRLVSAPSLCVRGATLCCRCWMVLCAAFALNACSLPINHHPHELVFNIQAAHFEVAFPVFDRREEASRQFRVLQKAPALFEYGDDQFHPSRLSFVASHLAAAFPRASVETPLVIERLDVQDSMSRPGGDQGYTGSGPPPVFQRLLRGNLSVERNYIMCRIQGSFGGVHFEVTQRAHYDNPVSKEHAQAVNGAMLAAITKAIEQVRERATSSSVPGRTEWSPLPLVSLPILSGHEPLQHQ